MGVGVRLAGEADWLGVVDALGYGVAVGGEVDVRVAVGCAVQVGLGVTVADRLEVAVALGVVAGVGCGVAVEVGLVAVEVGLNVEVGVDVAVAMLVSVGVADGMAGDDVGEGVGRARVDVGVAVLVGVAVRVGVLEFVGVRLGVAVSVATGWLPMRTTIWNGVPRLPLTSRTRPVRMVSPGGKVLSALMTAQNCTRRAAEETKAAESNASTVQARAGLVLAWKAQLKSFNAFATDCVIPKSGGLKPGMPPAVHTPGSPSPSGREVSICRSGRAVGSLGFQLNSTVPTAAPSLPGTASRTSWKPEPKLAAL